jgi:DNA-binding response OmpR family regulator
VLHSQVTAERARSAMLARIVEAAHIQEEPAAIQVGDLEIRPADGLCLAGGKALTLSVREFQLLVALARRAHGIVSRPDLYAQVWGGQLRDGDRSIDVYVHKLRVKLETALPGYRFIHTHVGFGYRLDPELSHSFHTSDTAG